MQRRDMLKNSAFLGAGALASGMLYSQAAQAAQRDELTQALSDCIEKCLRCRVHCLDMLKNGHNNPEFIHCIETTDDCMVVCKAMIQLYVANGASDLVRSLAKSCELACKLCEDQCKKLDMQDCQECAAACKKCAELCAQL